MTSVISSKTPMRVYNNNNLKFFKEIQWRLKKWFPKNFGILEPQKIQDILKKKPPLLKQSNQKIVCIRFLHRLRFSSILKFSSFMNAPLQWGTKNSKTREKFKHKGTNFWSFLVQKNPYCAIELKNLKFSERNGRSIRNKQRAPL